MRATAASAPSSSQPGRPGKLSRASSKRPAQPLVGQHGEHGQLPHQPGHEPVGLAADDRGPDPLVGPGRQERLGEPEGRPGGHRRGPAAQDRRQRGGGQPAGGQPPQQGPGAGQVPGLPPVAGAVQDDEGQRRPHPEQQVADQAGELPLGGGDLPGRGLAEGQRQQRQRPDAPPQRPVGGAEEHRLAGAAALAPDHQPEAGPDHRRDGHVDGEPGPGRAEPDQGRHRRQDAELGHGGAEGQPSDDPGRGAGGHRPGGRVVTAPPGGRHGGRAHSTAGGSGDRRGGPPVGRGAGCRSEAVRAMSLGKSSSTVQSTRTRSRFWGPGSFHR